MRAHMMVRIVAALGLALALAACSSSGGPSQSDLDNARADAKMYMDQVTAARTALMEAGATGETLVEMIASLGGTDVDVAALMAILTDAGAEGDTLEAQVNDLVADILKGKRDKETATISTVYGLLTPAILTPMAESAAPKDATKGNTQADPDMKSWSEVYDVIGGEPTITMTAQTVDAQNMRTHGGWADALIPGRGTMSDEDGDLSAEGMFDGIAGTFTCDSGEVCGIAFVADDTTGKIDTTTPPGAGWMFKPDDGLTTQVDVKDPNYVSYGFWLTKEDGDPTAFSVFYEGKGTYVDSRTVPTQTTETTATYSGPAMATGKYVTREIGGSGSLGYFTADANLTAVMPVSGNPTVSGTISNFMDGDMMPLGALKVDFDKDDDGDSTDVYSGTTSSKSHAPGFGSGTWQAKFYGGAADDAAPAEAAGAFSYGWTLGAVQGAFGAELDKDAE